MSTNRQPAKRPLVSSKSEREQVSRNTARANKVFDALNNFPGGFRAEFERQKAKQLK